MPGSHAPPALVVYWTPTPAAIRRAPGCVAGLRRHAGPMAAGSVYTYLTMTSGSRAGTSYLLDPTDDNRIGRGLECAVVLTDPLCSRVHVVIAYERQRLEDPRRRQPQRHVRQRPEDRRRGAGRRATGSGSDRPNSAFEQSETPPQFHHAGITVTQTLIKNQAIDQGGRRRLSRAGGHSGFATSAGAVAALSIEHQAAGLRRAGRSRPRGAGTVGRLDPCHAGRLFVDQRRRTTEAQAPGPRRRLRRGRLEQVADRPGLPAEERRLDRQPNRRPIRWKA